MSDVGLAAEALGRAAICCKVLEDDVGNQALISAYGARALVWQPRGEPNSLLWLHPDLVSARSEDHLDRLKGGPGGLRLWFSPEWAYGWDGKPDAAGFSNYVIQSAALAGKWVLRGGGRCATAETCDDLRDLFSGVRVSFTVERTIGLFSTPPREVRGAAAVFSGMSVQQRLQLSDPPAGALLDLWNILQLPAGSRMLFPVRRGFAPEIYFNASGKRGWREGPDLVEWPVSGDSETKWGLPASAVTGRLGALVPRGNGRSAFVAWSHPVLPGLPYPDGPRPGFDGDQAVQSWDGFGFGEMEYHSPAANGSMPVVVDSFVLWAFVGDPGEVTEIARTLLERDAKSIP